MGKIENMSCEEKVKYWRELALFWKDRAFYEYERFMNLSSEGKQEMKTKTDIEGKPLKRFSTAAILFFKGMISFDEYLERVREE